MESRTLSSRVRQRRNNEKKKVLLILFLFALALGLWLWYCFVYTRTPEYALRAVADACKRHVPPPSCKASTSTGRFRGPTTTSPTICCATTPR